MKATVDSGAFFKALNRVIPLLKVSAIPALSEASIQFRDGVCTITATDLELWIQTEIPAEGDDFGVVLSGTKSIAKAGKFFRGPLTFSCADAAVSSPQITMACADKSAEFTGHPLRDYPELPRFTCEQAYTANAAQLLACIGRIKYAAQRRSDSHPVMSGVRFYRQQLYCVDGQRLAVCANDAMTVDKTFVVPADAMWILKAFGDQNVSVQVDTRYVRFAADGLCAYVRRLETCDTLTPEVAIPRSERESYVVDRKEFLKRLTYLKECASPAKTTPVAYFENGCLSLQTPSARYRAAIELPVRSEVAFAFNLSYMWDALQQFSGHEKVRLHVLSPVSPVTITAEGTDDVALVLPVRYRAAA